MRCPKCENRDLVTITLTVGGEAVWLERCPRCETSSWRRSDGDELTRDGVLALVRSSR